MRIDWGGIGKIVVIAGLFSLPSCSNADGDYCSRLATIAEDESVQEYLVAWVDEKILQQPLTFGRVKSGGLMIPGRYMLLDGPDWSVLGFSAEDSQVRLVGPSASDVNSGDLRSSVASVFFGERSRYGILVKTSSAPDVGLGADLSFVTWITDQVGVVCIHVDW